VGKGLSVACSALQLRQLQVVQAALRPTKRPMTLVQGKAALLRLAGLELHHILIGWFGELFLGCPSPSKPSFPHGVDLIILAPLRPSLLSFRSPLHCTDQTAMALPRPSCLRGAIGRSTLRKAGSQGRAKTFRDIGRRTYASGHEAKKSSDIPWYELHMTLVIESSLTHLPGL
jgi:hypothetical protein